eukprot:CAMPEP_0114984288 /NCGR_PEP_ID=MMETSP0216-20121206/7196_1 /TAXON_ID=223996 /ORGANISM="Protocruzia adherens, Strain Boccale" /LENGTH=569 /DNA_ID=CAMNT_0002346413 /DNA_START=24 /DNA_END=1729 /DNA_ORIENTATION=-
MDSFLRAKPNKNQKSKVVEKAKKAREARAQHEQRVLRIQKVWRRYSVISKFKATVRESLEKKLRDLDKVLAVLKGKPFSLPIETLNILMRDFNLSCSVTGKKSDQDIIIMEKLLVWISKSLHHTDPKLNIGNFLLTPDVIRDGLAVRCQINLSKISRSLIRAIQEKGYRKFDFFRSLFLLQEWGVEIEHSRTFPLFKIMSHLVAKCDLYKSLEKILSSIIRCNLDNKINDQIRPMIALLLTTVNFPVKDLVRKEYEQFYEDSVTNQARFIEIFMAIPRFTKFLLQYERLDDVNFKNMFQAYYYTKLVQQEESKSQDSKRSHSKKVDQTPKDQKKNVMYMFGNIWEVFIRRMLSKMNVQEMTPILMICSDFAKHISPRLLSQDPGASIDDGLEVQTLRSQLDFFTDPKNIVKIFRVIFDADSAGFSDKFHPLAALALCEVYSTFLAKCNQYHDFHALVMNITNGLAFNNAIMTKIWRFIDSHGDLGMLMEGTAFIFKEYDQWLHTLSLFCMSFSHLLIVMDIDELYEGNVLSTGDLARIVKFVAPLVFKFYLNESYLKDFFYKYLCEVTA